MFFFIHIIYVYGTYFILLCLSHIQYIPKVEPNFGPL